MKSISESMIAAGELVLFDYEKILDRRELALRIYTAMDRIQCQEDQSHQQSKDSQPGLREKKNAPGLEAARR